MARSALHCYFCICGVFTMVPAYRVNKWTGIRVQKACSMGARCVEIFAHASHTAASTQCHAAKLRGHHSSVMSAQHHCGMHPTLTQPHPPVTCQCHLHVSHIYKFIQPTQTTTSRPPFRPHANYHRLRLFQAACMLLRMPMASWVTASTGTACRHVYHLCTKISVFHDRYN